MFSDLVIAIFIGLGIGTWVFTKVQRSSGGNTKSSATAGAVAGVFSIVILTIVIQFVFKHFK